MKDPRFSNTTITDKDEYLHSIDTDNWDAIETSWFGCTHLNPTPDRHIVIFPYIHMRRTVGVVWCGMSIFEGINYDQVEARYHNARLWSKMPEGDFDEKGISFENGLSVKMLEPGKVFQIDFVDQARNTEVHFTWTGVTDRFMWITDNHFDQVGKVEGHLILEGERFEIDTYNVRDRGWAPRSEAPVNGAPAFEYVGAVIDEKNAFGVFGFDKDTMIIGGEGKPAFTAQVADAEFLPTSWILKDGVPYKIKSSDFTVTRDPHNGYAQKAIEAKFIDEQDVEHHLKADVVAYCPYHFPVNSICATSSIEGTFNGEPLVGKWDESIENQTMQVLLKNHKEKK